MVWLRGVERSYFMCCWGKGDGKAKKWTSMELILSIIKYDNNIYYYTYNSLKLLNQPHLSKTGIIIYTGEETEVYRNMEFCPSHKLSGKKGDLNLDLCLQSPCFCCSTKLLTVISAGTLHHYRKIKIIAFSLDKTSSALAL